ncbi:hypothetical protein N9901_02845 [Flavobacteriaceae bacterium]|nr:hypothetical protein [Flavobacteriaceae bacterium]
MNDKTKILSLHPQGKNGVNILKHKYDVIKNYILQTLETNTVISYQELNRAAIIELSPTFDGKVGWYLVSVKLDLEARGIIERIPKTSPHQIRLKV